MKKVLLILATITFTSSMISAQEIEVPQTQRSLINKVAADWCPPCGSWGWDFFHDLIDDNSNNAILFTIHHSGGLNSQVASDITSNYFVSSQPRFILNGEDQNVLSGSTSSARTAIQQEVISQSGNTPLVQTGLDATYRDDDMVHVNTRTTFFADADGEYYLGVYLVEKIVVAFQASQGQSAQHQQIVRQEFSGTSSFGSLIAMGSIGANTSYDFQFSIPKDSYNAENLEIVTIIWKKDGNVYEFVNANKDSNVQFEVVNSTTAPGVLESSFKVFPNVVNDYANIQFQTEKNIERASINLFDMKGKNVLNVFNGSLDAGEYNFDLSRSSEIPSGIYLLRLEVEGNVVTRKLIME
ncbi:MAG: T9SS C-terminal target domain-containing protein [Bacteroidetes bacterium]|nr:MAG: T9SS C-terminal target domain-containing protein [Bacteroidota bacterium]